MFYWMDPPDQFLEISPPFLRPPYFPKSNKTWKKRRTGWANCKVTWPKGFSSPNKTTWGWPLSTAYRAMLPRTRGVENDFPAALLLQIGAHCSGSVLCTYHPKTPAAQPLNASMPSSCKKWGIPTNCCPSKLASNLGTLRFSHGFFASEWLNGRHECNRLTSNWQAMWMGDVNEKSRWVSRWDVEIDIWLMLKPNLIAPLFVI